MNLGDLILQNFFGLVATVIGGLILGFARRILVTSKRTEAHAQETANKLSDLDRVSLTASNRALEEWQRDMALRVEAVAELKSDTLAGQANNDRRVTALSAELAEVRAELAACKRFMWELDAYAHGTGPVPIFSPEDTYTTGTHALEGASRDTH